MGNTEPSNTGDCPWAGLGVINLGIGQSTQPHTMLNMGHVNRNIPHMTGNSAEHKQTRNIQRMTGNTAEHKQTGNIPHMTENTVEHKQTGNIPRMTGNTAEHKQTGNTTHLSGNWPNDLSNFDIGHIGIPPASVHPHVNLIQGQYPDMTSRIPGNVPKMDAIHLTAPRLASHNFQMTNRTPVHLGTIQLGTQSLPRPVKVKAIPPPTKQYSMTLERRPKVTDARQSNLSQKLGEEGSPMSAKSCGVSFKPSVIVHHVGEEGILGTETLPLETDKHTVGKVKRRSNNMGQDIGLRQELITSSFV